MPDVQKDFSYQDDDDLDFYMTKVKNEVQEQGQYFQKDFDSKEMDEKM